MEGLTKISLCAAVVAASLATTAQAEVAETTVNVYAGLASVLELECEPVNFGVWLVPEGTRAGGPTTITLDETGDASVTGGSAGRIALQAESVGTNRKPTAGDFTVTGSLRTGGDGAARIKGDMDDVTAGFGKVGSDNEFFSNLKVPVAVPSGFSHTLKLNNYSPTISSTGTASFKVIGTMEIPNGLIADNYGGFKGAAIAVSFSDNET